MEDWFSLIAAESALPPDAARRLSDMGFVVVPGSHLPSRAPGSPPEDAADACEGQVLACGPAGSIIIFDGSVRHGHTANRSARRRRSIQGAFIPREARSANDQTARIRPETLRRIGALAKYVLDVGAAGPLVNPTRGRYLPKL